MPADATEYLKIEYGEDKAAKLIAYADAVLERNEHINLTAIRDREEFLEKHIIDSLACCGMPEYESAVTVADLGTGAGFPGIPLAVISPKKNFVLIDAQKKKLAVIEELAGGIGITNFRTLHSRAEEAGRVWEYRDVFDVCVSRAVASLDVLVEWCLPLVRPGGTLIAYKGMKAAEEAKQAAAAVKALGGELDRIEGIGKDTNWAGEISGHELVVIKKVASTPDGYPRKPGDAKRDPIR
jgi:16S rRNA (guanine527-N7)-methyltransferase